MITGTVEQQAIWEEIQHGTGHIIVDAGAGVGKTFTIVEERIEIMEIRKRFWHLISQ